MVGKSKATVAYLSVFFLYIENQGSPKTGPCLTPAEVLIAIHLIDPEKDGIPLKQVSIFPFCSYVGKFCFLIGQKIGIVFYADY